MSTAKKNNLLRQGTILAAAGILVRIIGMFYRIPLANIIGDDGNGVYSVAFNVYNIALVLSSYGIPMAVSKMISAGIARNETKNIKKIFVASLLFAICTGGVAALVIFFGANWLATNIYTGYAGIEYPLKVLAPTVFIVAVLGVVRGFFQGHSNMIPTAVSQVIEQIVNACVSIIAALILVSMHTGSDKIAGFGAMGGTFGTCFGAIAALICVSIWYIVKRKDMLSGMVDAANEKVRSYGEIFNMILLTTVPIIIGQTFYQISAVFDDIIFGKAMAYKGFGPEVITSSSGVYNAIYVLMISIPMGVASALASSTLPNVVKSYTKGDIADARDKVYSVIKFNMMIAIPSTVGLMVVGGPIVRMLFPRLDYVTGGNMLRLGGMAVVFYALSTISSSVLQAVDKINKPVVHSAISLVIHVPLTFILVLFTDLKAYALVIGYMTFPIVVAVLNMIEIRKTIGYKQEIKKTYGITTLCAVIMGICTWGCYTLLMSMTQNNTISILVALVVALVTYFGSMKAMNNI